MKEIRWHARAGQGAKTASQLLATAAVRAGKSVQAFPEYGPERRGAPLRAYTRLDERPIRRHDSVTNPDVVVVIEPSLLRELDVTDGLRTDGIVIFNGDVAPPDLAGLRVVCVPASAIAARTGSKFANLVLVGAVAGTLGDIPEHQLADTAVELLGRKAKADEVREAVREGFGWAG